MKITEDLTESSYGIIDVINAEYAGDFSIHLQFSDGSSRLVNFKDFLSRAIHPSIKKYANEEKFRQFKLVDGNVNWNDFDMVFPVWDLYTGKIA